MISFRANLRGLDLPTTICCISEICECILMGISHNNLLLMHPRGYFHVSVWHSPKETCYIKLLCQP